MRLRAGNAARAERVYPGMDAMRIYASPLISAMLAIAVSVPLFAVETQPVDLKQVRAQYADMLKANDLWSALQIEAYAAAQKLDLRAQPVFGASEVFGEPLFACPDDILTCVDRGPTISVVTRRRYHSFLPDGRPAAPSVSLGQRCDQCDLAFDGGFVGALRFDVDWEHRPERWEARVVGCPGPVPIVINGDEPPDSRPQDDAVAVANDGSALAIGLQHRDGHSYRIVLAVGKGRRVLDGLRRPSGIGPNGNWLAVEEADGGQHLVIMGDTRVPVRCSAVGPGMLAALGADGRAFIVGKDGKTQPFAPPLTFGPQPRMLSIGRWLVVGSGGGAKADRGTDLLGLDIGPHDQPHMFALYRWDDLAADQKSAPVQVHRNPLEQANTRAAAVYLWRGGVLEILDLSGKDPVSTPLARFERHVDWVFSLPSYIGVAVHDQGMVILDDQGREVWSGKDVEPRVVHRDWAVLRHDRGGSAWYELARLSADPAARSQVKLKLPLGEWEIFCDPHQGRVCARRWDGWILLNLSGEELARGVQNSPGVRGFWPPVGRFYPWYGRLFAKSVDQEFPLPPRVHPRDAWMIGRVLLLLDRDARVFTSGKKRGEFIDLGYCLGGGDRFCLRREDVVVTDGSNKALAAIMPGPALVPDPARTDSDPPAPGPWRIDNLQFAAPGSGSMDWSEDRTGFRPERLRSPKNSEGSRMLAITASLVINLDPSTAKLVGKK
jgi:hypothetical protein